MVLIGDGSLDQTWGWRGPARYPYMVYPERWEETRTLPALGPSCPKCGSFYGYKQTYEPDTDMMRVKCTPCGYSTLKEPLTKG